MRLRLLSGHYGFQAIWFSVDADTAAIAAGDLVDVAFVPQINEFRGDRSVQMNITDIRPHCEAECSMDTAAYRAMWDGTIDATAADRLLPDRNTLAIVWRYLAAAPAGVVQENPACLLRKIVRWSGQSLGLGKLLTCLDIFSDVGLLQMTRLHKHMTIRLANTGEKAALSQSRTMQQLIDRKEERNGNL